MNHGGNLIKCFILRCGICSNMPFEQAIYLGEPNILFPKQTLQFVITYNIIPGSALSLEHVLVWDINLIRPFFLIFLQKIFLSNVLLDNIEIGRAHV